MLARSHVNNGIGRQVARCNSNNMASPLCPKMIGYMTDEDDDVITRSLNERHNQAHQTLHKRNSWMESCTDRHSTGMVSLPLVEHLTSLPKSTTWTCMPRARAKNQSFGCCDMSETDVYSKSVGSLAVWTPATLLELISQHQQRNSSATGGRQCVNVEPADEMKSLAANFRSNCDHYQQLDAVDKALTADSIADDVMKGRSRQNYMTNAIKMSNVVRKKGVETADSAAVHSKRDVRVSGSCPEFCSGSTDISIVDGNSTTRKLSDIAGTSLREHYLVEEIPSTINDQGSRRSFTTATDSLEVDSCHRTDVGRLRHYIQGLDYLTSLTSANVNSHVAAAVHTKYPVSNRSPNITSNVQLLQPMLVKNSINFPLLSTTISNDGATPLHAVAEPKCANLDACRTINLHHCQLPATRIIAHEASKISVYFITQLVCSCVCIISLLLLLFRPIKHISGLSAQFVLAG